MKTERLTREQQQLVVDNLALVIHWAKSMRGWGRVDHEDLVGAGNVGLVEAARRFDPERGIRFSTYATWWIRAAIFDAIRADAGVVAGGKVNTLFWRLCDDKTDTQLADQIGIDEHTVTAMRATVIMGALRLDHPRPDLEHETLPPLRAALAHNSETPEQRAIDDDLIDWVRREIPRLPRHERTVIRARYSENPVILAEAGRRIGTSREWARKLELRAVERLRKRMRRA